VRLARLKIGGFKSLAGLDWRPAPGLNLVLGPNEAGKSSLAEFIEAMLFGLPGGSGGEQFRPWSGTDFCGRLELECGRILVSLEREFADGTTRYEERDLSDGSLREELSGQLRRGSGGPLAARYRQLLSRHMGFFDPRLFRRSTYVPQGELLLAGRDFAEAAAALRSLASGGGSGYDRALEKLNERYYALTSEGDGRRRPGSLERMREEKRELSARLRDAEHVECRSAELRQELDSARDQLRCLSDERRVAEDRLERLRERAELLSRRTALISADRADRQRLAAAEQAGAEGAGLERKLAASEDLENAGEDFPRVVSRAREADARVRRLTADLEGLKRAAPRSYPYFRALAAGGAAVIIGGAALAAGLLSTSVPAVIAGAAVGFAGLVSALVVLHFRRRGDAQALVHRESVRRSARDLSAAREQLEAATAELLARTDGRVDFREEAMEVLMRRYWDRRELLARRRALESTLMDREQIEELRAHLGTTVRELAVIDERIERCDAGLDSRDGEDGNGRRLGAAAKRVQELSGLAERCGSQVHQLEIELATVESRGAVPPGVGEQLESVAGRIARQESRCRALLLARTELSSSIREFQESHLDRLADIAGHALSSFSLGRCRRVTLDPETLVPSVDLPEAREVPEAGLSRGVRSALYLALRLAMAKLVSGGRELPLVLDDPLVDLDPARRAAGMELLRELGEAGQVLLLSFDRDLVACGAPVLALPG
jgi:DNA repair exonuclease SbcCD ATPase subunit